MGRKVKDLSGEKFNKLRVVELSHRDKSGKIHWTCLCDCGNITAVYGGHLKSERTKSCGCIKVELLQNTKPGIKHNLSNTSEYNIWHSMKKRCYDPNNQSYKNYGGRGITVCNEWINDFKQFFKDMGPRSSPQHSINRKNNNDNYKPDNCEWSTLEEQNNNKRTTKKITYKNQTKSLKNWCDELSLPYNTVFARLNRYKWSIQKAFENQIKKHINYELL